MGLGTSLAVAVHDQSNSPVAGISVTWTAPAGGKVNGSPTVITQTNASGAASVTLALGTAAGTQTATAAATGVVGSPVSFTETATPGNPFALALSSQSATTGPPNGTLTYNVIAKDKYGNPVSGVTVQWAVTAGGGGVTPTTSVTNASGIASTQHQLGPADGKDTVTATSSGLQGSPVSIAALIVTAPATASVTVGPGISFSPTLDTIRAGGTVTFTWAAGSITHGVEWTGGPAPLPAASANMTSGTYMVMLNNPGTYSYDCTVHGAAMKGTIVVQ